MATQTQFKQFLSALNDDQLNDFAQRCGTTYSYLMVQLFHGYKIPRRDLMASLALNSGGALTRNDLLDHFYPAALFQSAA